MRYPYRKSRRAAVRATVAAGAALAAALVAMAQPASAIPTDPDPSANPCIANSTFSLTASRGSVVWGQSITLTASMNLAPGCSVLPIDMSIQFIDGQSGMNYFEPVSPYQSTVIPPATGHYDLVVVNSGQVYHVASAGVTVAYPKVNGHPFARITPNIPDEAATFEQAVEQDGAQVYIQGDVNLDLSEMSGIVVHPGVQIIGERDAAHPNGPRLFTTSFPYPLLQIGTTGDHPADNVRITGIRFDGMEPSDPCDSAGNDFPDADAIDIYASTGVQIDHDEFHSWRGSAVNVQDSDESTTDAVKDRLNPVTGKAGVWIHDNYMHDNQHPTVCSDWDPFASDGHGAGYGVDDSHGGFSYIQGNLFDSNRHSIAGGGQDGSGYILTGNMFLNPGVDDVKVITNYNHQIDMHGTGTCDDLFTHESYNCGQGGLYMEVANNTVVGYTAAAIQLRGQPANTLHFTPGVPNNYGMYVHDNVFNSCESCALTETFDSNGLVEGSGNQFATDPAEQQTFAVAFNDPSSSGPFCDFDGDGTQDAFRDVAGVFWYHSSRFGRWTYMTTNNVPAAGLTFGDVNGDGLCDVSNASGVVYQMPPLFESFPLSTPVPNLNGLTQSAAQDAIAAAGLQFDTVNLVPSLNPAGTVIGQSRAAGSSAQAGSLVSLTVSGGGVLLPNVNGMTEANARAALGNAGLAIGNVSHDTNAAWPGTVYTENPAPGTNVIVLPGSTVNFGVSLGPAVSVPNIMNDTDAEARQAIAAAGLNVGTVGSTPNCVDPGTVQTQNPVQGVQVNLGTTVTYSLSTCSGGGGGSGGGGSTGGGGGNGGGHILPK